MSAQRVGAISNYKKVDDKRATFEVIPVGKEKGFKCSAWLMLGEDWDEAAKQFKSRKANPLIAQLDDMRAADLAGPWVVEGDERFVNGKEHSYRAFTAKSVRPAQSWEQDVFTMDMDGNEIDASKAANGAAASGLVAAEVDFDRFLLSLVRLPSSVPPAEQMKILALTLEDWKQGKREVVEGWQ